jgi:hypothetical protein
VTDREYQRQLQELPRIERIKRNKHEMKVSRQLLRITSKWNPLHQKRSNVQMEMVSASPRSKSNKLPRARNPRMPQRQQRGQRIPSQYPRREGMVNANRIIATI